MAASTASMCLRRESLSVHSHKSSQDSSRFTGASSKGFRAAILPAAAAATTSPPLAARVGDVYDAAAGVRLLHGAGSVVGRQDDLQAATARILFLDAARELLSFEGVAFGNPAAQDVLFAPDGADAGESGLGIALETEHDARRVGSLAEGGFRGRCALRLLLPGGRGDQVTLLGPGILGAGPLAGFVAGTGGSHQEQDGEQSGHEGRRHPTLAW